MLCTNVLHSDVAWRSWRPLAGTDARADEPQPAAAALGFEDAIFFDKGSDDLLLVPLQPAGNHGDEHVEDHGVSWGWRQRQSWSVPYTPYLRNFNGITTAEIFNLTR